MSENWKVQVSVKTPMGTLINARCESESEFDAELEMLGRKMAQILALEQQMSAAGNVAAAMPLSPQQPPQPPSPWGGAPAAPVAPPPPPAQGGWGAPAAPQPQAGPAPMCKHNVAAKLVPAGISKKTGSPYKAFYACAFDREHQCDFRQVVG